MSMFGGASGQLHTLEDLVRRVATLEHAEDFRRTTESIIPTSSVASSVAKLRRDVDRMHALLKQFGYEYSADPIGWREIETEEDDNDE